MRTGRPRTPIGTHGAINTRREGGRVVAETRVRGLDGGLRQVRAWPTAAAARTRLLGRMRELPSLPSSGVLRPTSSFADLADLWLADLDLRDLGATPRRTIEPACGSTSARARALHARRGDHWPGRVVPGQAGQGVAIAGQADPDHAQHAFRLCTASRRYRPAPGRRHVAASPGQDETSGALARPAVRSARQPQGGAASLVSPGPSRTARSGTSSKSCSAPPCAPGRCSPSGPATSRTFRPG